MIKAEPENGVDGVGRGKVETVRFPMLKQTAKRGGNFTPPVAANRYPTHRDIGHEWPLSE
ncbi:MAG: hypothetical protein H6668_01415 [Ardenticatenaceae bacterium]|nr:hypothetical protein [Ardenticatenaceae bacterium]